MTLYKVFVEHNWNGETMTSEMLFVDIEDAKNYIADEHEFDDTSEIWLRELDTDRKGPFGRVYIAENTRIY